MTMPCRLAALVLAAAAPLCASAQARSMAQDASLDNLVHAANTSLTPMGTLGRVRSVGTGPRHMVLIAGMGFGDDTWDEFAQGYRDRYTMHLVTLPGFGGTPPLPMPGGAERYTGTPWLQSSIDALAALIAGERMGPVTLVAQWIGASQVALRLAALHPDLVESVVLVSGVLKVYYEGTPGMLTWTPAQRRQFVEGMSSRWFRTVTRKTWDDNNFMSYDYAVNPRRALALWRAAAEPALATWIQYLLEFYAVDWAQDVQQLKVPVLVVQPGFDDAAYYVEPGFNYMRNLCIDTWRGAESLNTRLRIVPVPGSRVFMQYDEPQALRRVVDDFLAASGKD